MPKIYQGVWGVREMTQFTESRQKLFSFSLLPFVCDESSLTQILSISGGRKTTGPPKVNVNDNRTRRNSVSIIILMIVCCQWALFINVQMTTLLYTLQKYIHYPSVNYIAENFDILKMLSLRERGSKAKDTEKTPVSQSDNRYHTVEVKIDNQTGDRIPTILLKLAIRSLGQNTPALTH